MADARLTTRQPRAEADDLGRELAVIRAVDPRTGREARLALAERDWVQTFDPLPGGAAGTVARVVDATPEGLSLCSAGGQSQWVPWEALRDAACGKVRLVYAEPPVTPPTAPAGRSGPSSGAAVARPAPKPRPAAPTGKPAGVRQADLRAERALELREIKLALAAQAEGLTEMLLGQKASIRAGDDIRFGKHGAFKLTVNGRGRGLWHDHSANTGSDMLGLIQERQGISFPDAVAWARDYLGMPQPDRGKTFTPEERARMAAHLADVEARAAREAEADAAALLERHETVARRAAAVWERSRPATAQHGYLLAKGVQPHGLRLDRVGRLRIPMRDESGRVWSLQHIRQFRDGSNLKRFHFHGRAAGLFYVLGDVSRPGPIAFAEGFATGASVHEATGLAVVVCFSVGNKERVMTEWRAREPDRGLVDAADNDHSKPRRDPPERNAGAEMAEKLQRDIGAVPALPPFEMHEKGTDWNDYGRTHGAEAVRATMERALSAVKA